MLFERRFKAGLTPIITGLTLFEHDFNAV